MLNFLILFFSMTINVTSADEIDCLSNIKHKEEYLNFLKITKRAKIELNIKSFRCPPENLTSLISGIEKGVSCLEALNTPLTKSILERIDKLLMNQEKKIKLVCLKKFDDPNHFAISTYPNEPGYPKIKYNLQSPSSDMEALGFHEFLHLVGYPFVHGFEPDRTNACESCCFGDKNPEAESCKICSEVPDSEKNYDCSFLIKKDPRINKHKIYNHTESEILKSYPRAKELAEKGNVELLNIAKCYP